MPAPGECNSIIIIHAQVYGAACQAHGFIEFLSAVNQPTIDLAPNVASSGHGVGGRECGIELDCLAK